MVFPLRCHDFENRPKWDFREISHKMPNFTKSENLQKWSHEVGICDSFWPQRPPKVQKIGLGWFPQLVRPPRADLRKFSIFFENFVLCGRSSKINFLNFRVRNFFSKIIFHNICQFSLKLWYFSSILVYSHRAYSHKTEIPIIWNKNGRFFPLMCNTLFWNALNLISRVLGQM